METITFTHNSQSYEIKELTSVRKTIAYYNLRNMLSNGNYTNLVNDYVGVPAIVVEMIDCKAFFQVYCQEFVTNLKPQSLDDLSVKDFKEILETYKTQIQPKFEELHKVLSTK